ncbi:MAG: 2-C-methyl-D-erythritol 2,4-cyclodiphosphate synthase [Trueperaceae bacterium]|nr:MAG: 2-C-methyl-D-erythritol 2,4-cyclodiphosphate synthase [Trueperaceae bacterium]
MGFGEDAHRLEAGRTLIIGGVTIPESPLGSLAHSDGDVLLHALADALLSSYALADIGYHFPPSDPAFADLDSSVIVKAVLERLKDLVGELTVHNVAAVITLDHPRLGGYRDTMRATVAKLLGLEPSRVGITFKTSEGLAPNHIQARVTVLVSTEAEITFQRAPGGAR